MTCRDDLCPPEGFDNHGVIERDGYLVHETCGEEFFNGCQCYIGEWKCLRCGSFTFPFSGLSFDDGCVNCGSDDVVQPGPEEALNWRNEQGLPW
jgi:hypothetical protein